jgi:transmembrane sensor
MSTELRGPLKSVLEDPIEHEALERVRRKVHASRKMPAHHPWRWAPVAAAALVALSIGAVWSFDREEPAIADVGPLRIQSGSPLRSVRGDADGTEVALHEGSLIALDPRTRLDAVENGSTRVLLAQGDGRAVYDVHPGGPRRWSIDAGSLTVDVVGTRFTIVRSGARVRVDVHHGRVRVRGTSVRGGLRTLVAGDSIEIGAEERPTPRAETPRPTTARNEPAIASPIAPIEREPRDDWRELADRGAYDDAFRALGADGLTRAAERSRSVDELFALADTARLSGHPELAIDPLERVSADHSTDGRAGVAALTLGRLLLDALDRPEPACASLDRAVELGLPAHLSEVAEARRVEAHRRAGHRDRAIELARAYLERFPEGRNAERIRSWLDAQ